MHSIHFIYGNHFRYFIENMSQFKMSSPMLAINIALHSDVTDDFFRLNVVENEL